MKDETQLKDEIILVVKEAIRDNTSVKDIDDTAELDSNDVDHIAEAVADRLYADGWRKDEGLDFVKKRKKKLPKGTPIVAWEFSKRDTPFVGVYIGVDGGAIGRSSNKNEGYFVLEEYRKQSDTVREFVQKLKEADERCQKKYGEGVGFTELKEIAEEYGVKREDL